MTPVPPSPKYRAMSRVPIQLLIDPPRLPVRAVDHTLGASHPPERAGIGASWSLGRTPTHARTGNGAAARESRDARAPDVRTALPTLLSWSAGPVRHARMLTRARGLVRTRRPRSGRRCRKRNARTVEAGVAHLVGCAPRETSRNRERPRIATAWSSRPGVRPRELSALPGTRRNGSYRLAD